MTNGEIKGLEVWMKLKTCLSERTGVNELKWFKTINREAGV